MSKFLFAAFFSVALLSGATAAASSTSAVTWRNIGDTAFTATGGAMTFTSAAVTLGCGGGQTVGTAPSGSFVGAIWSMSLTTTYTGCTLSLNNLPWECSRTCTGTSQPVAGQTNGTMDTTCRVYLGPSEICHVDGTEPATYINPVPPSTSGRFVLPTSTTLRVTNAAVGTCLMGPNDLMHMSAQTWTVSAGSGGLTSPDLGPVVTRTA